MRMIEKLTDWFINRRLKQLQIDIPTNASEKEIQFIRAMNTFRNNSIFLQVRDDGIYIRLAGREDMGESFSKEFVKIKSF